MARHAVQRDPVAEAWPLPSAPEDLAGRVLDPYPRCRLQGVRFLLVEATDRILPEVPEGLAGFAARELGRRGLEILTATTLDAAGQRTCELSTGETIRTRNVVWTAGVAPAPVVARLGLPRDEGGRIRTDPTLRVEGHGNVWAVGDAAAVPDPQDPDRPCPPTAQHAMRHGRLAGRNVAAVLGSGDAVRPYDHRTQGFFVDLGRHRAVASTFGLESCGLPAWLLARAYHLAQLPGARRKLRVALGWTIDLLSGREASETGQLGHRPALGSAGDGRAERTGADGGGDGAATIDDATAHAGDLLAGESRAARR